MTDSTEMSVDDLARRYPPLGPFWLTIKPFFPNFWRTLASSSTGMLYSSAISLVLTIRGVPFEAMRSEEHTSELQSRLHLVCRLLLEKKKKKNHTDGVLTCRYLDVPS